MAISRGQLANQISKPPMKGDKKMKKSNPTPKGLTYFRKVEQLQRNQRGVKFAQKGRLGQNALIHPSAYANLAASNTVKTQTMLKSLKAVKERASNG